MGDGELLDRFARRRDEAAFAALVARHGPMILGLCRQWLRDHHDAEDAFQAVFLVLARKAGSIGEPDLLGNWLYGVARRTAEKARVRIARRRGREGRGDPMDERELVDAQGAPGRPQDEFERSEALHKELGRLPSKFRLPIVLCHLEGLTHDEAARRLRVPVGTVRSRLSRGRDRLRDRLGRRGLAVPSVAILAAPSGEQATAGAMPGLIERATRAALQDAAGRTAIGAVSVASLELADEVTRSLLMTKWKSVAVALMSLGAVAGVGAITIGAWRAAPPPAVAGPRVVAVAKIEPDEVPKGEKMIATGRVLLPDGRPATGAKVVILARPRAAGRGGELGNDAEMLGRIESAGDGRFRLEVARTSSSRHMEVKALASLEGFGMNWAEINSDAPSPDAEIRLLPEQVIRGRLVDLQGLPAAGVTVGINSVRRPTGLGQDPGIWNAAPPEDLPAWPRPATTDPDGRFVLRGMGRGQAVGVSIVDPRFARQTFYVNLDDAGPAKVISESLEPAKVIEGRVTYADTGKPVPHALLNATVSQEELGSMFSTPFRADAEGRFRMNPTPGRYFRISAYAPAGEPYLIVQDEFAWPKGAAKHELNLALPRGVLLRGAVVEAGGGRPIANASIQFQPSRSPGGMKIIEGWQAIVPSGPDGKFSIAVPPGQGHLMVYGPSNDYVHAEIGGRMLRGGSRGAPATTLTRSCRTTPAPARAPGRWSPPSSRA